MELPGRARKVVQAAAAAGVEIAVRSFPAGTKTAADAAAAIGCEVAAIVKSLVFVADGRPVVGLVPGDLRLDPEALAAACGAAVVRRASLDEVRRATGFPAGGVPPFGHATRLEVIADERLRRHERVWAAAGTPTTVFPISPSDLLAVSGGRWGAIAG